MSVRNSATRIFAICRAILWAASWLAPAPVRAEWRASRIRQVLHWCLFLAETGRFDRGNKIELARYCWRAFPDALWLRFDREKFLRDRDRLFGSPWVCLAAIAVAAVTVLVSGGAIPAARAVISSPLSDPDRIAVISLNGKFRRVHTDTLLDLAAAWKRSKLLNAVAPYSWGPGNLQAGQRSLPILSARVAPDFFQVLGLNAAIGRNFRGGDEKSCRDCVVLSNEIWRYQFHSDASLVGRQVVVDGTPRTVIGVLPRNFRLLSGNISAWTLLDSGTPPFSNFVERIGAVARTAPGATGRRVEAELADLSENAGYVFPASLLTVTSETTEARRYLISYLLFVLLAVACAMLIVYARSGGEVGRAPLSARDRVRWWAFFVGKTLLLLAFTGLLAWTLVRWMSISLYGSVHPMTNAVALWVFLLFSVAPLSWAIRDQQRRCRVCLRRLGTPIQIGVPGPILLDWSGTEMVCPDGHGVLYLPDSQANWLERARWDNLDESWADLFKGSG